MANVSKLLLIMYGIIRYHPVSPRNVTRRCESKWAWYVWFCMYEVVGFVGFGYCLVIHDLFINASFWFWHCSFPQPIDHYWSHWHRRWWTLILLSACWMHKRDAYWPTLCTMRVPMAARTWEEDGGSTNRINILLIGNSGRTGLQCLCSSWKGRSWFMDSLGLIGLAMMGNYCCTWPEARAKQTWARHLNFFSSVVCGFGSGTTFAQQQLFCTTYLAEVCVFSPRPLHMYTHVFAFTKCQPIAFINHAFNISFILHTFTVLTVLSFLRSGFFPGRQSAVDIICWGLCAAIWCWDWRLLGDLWSKDHGRCLGNESARQPNGVGRVGPVSYGRWLH